ncbi:MAG TPA: hypothetical protein VN792_05360 [Candidatus Acidoferrales bacterium]|nr:hypothetical protein [Candidatus Acidoferrales bacterium]
MATSGTYYLRHAEPAARRKSGCRSSVRADRSGRALGNRADSQARQSRNVAPLRAALERKGGRPGPKQRPAANRWKIETLREIARGKPLKQSVRQPRRSPQSASAELGRFCREFYWLCEFLEAHEPESWRKPRAAKLFKEQLGFAFPRDVAAAEEAYRRGRAAAEHSLREYDRFTRASRN